MILCRSALPSGQQRSFSAIPLQKPLFTPISSPFYTRLHIHALHSPTPPQQPHPSSTTALEFWRLHQIARNHGAAPRLGRTTTSLAASTAPSAHAFTAPRSRSGGLNQRIRVRPDSIRLELERGDWGGLISDSDSEGIDSNLSNWIKKLGSGDRKSNSCDWKLYR